MRSDSFQSDRDAIEDLEGYRPLNWLALVALLVALPGCFAPLLPVLVLFSALAIGLALFSLWRGRGAKSNGAGIGMAWFCLALSTFFLCLSTTLHYVNARRDSHAAVSVANTWLELLRGKNPREAFLLSLAYNLRPVSADQDLPKMMRTGQGMAVLDSDEQFLELPEIILIANPVNKLTLLGLTHKFTHRRGTDYSISYLLQATQPEPANLIAIIELYQRPDTNGTIHWQFGQCRIVRQ